MRILVTSARMPFALAVIRRLCEAGHEVFSSDTYARGAAGTTPATSPGTP